MNTKFLFFSAAFICATVCSTANAAMVVKKAAPVATKSASVMDSSASLLGTAIGLVTSVRELNAKQKQLTDECIPSSAEINFVNTMVKEWAKTGAMSLDKVKERMSGQQPCQPGTSYQDSVRESFATDVDNICYDSFNSSSDEGNIWRGYPKASVATYCADGGTTCTKNKKTVSNIYEVFNMIDFEEDDYTKKEAETAGKLIGKIENCSTAKLSARKKELWGNFLMGTLGGMGQKTNTATIMQSVSGITSSMGSGGGIGGALGGLSNLGGLATQFLDK